MSNNQIELYSIVLRKRSLKLEGKVDNIEDYDRYDLMYQTNNKSYALGMFNVMAEPSHQDSSDWKLVSAYIGPGKTNRAINDSKSVIETVTYVKHFT